MNCNINFETLYRTPRSSRVLRYAGDVKENLKYTPKTSNTALRLLVQSLKVKNKKIRMLRQANYRKKIKILSMKELLLDLKSKCFISKNAHNILQV